MAAPAMMKRAPPAARRCDQACDEDAAQPGAQGGSGVKDGGAAAAFGFVHPDGVQFSARRHDAGLGDADAQAGDEHAEEAAGQAGCCCCGAPADAGRGHHLAGAELVDQPADGDLHEGVGPEEGREQEAHELRGHVEFLLDDGQGNRDGTPVDVVHGHEDQQEQEHFPADFGAPLHAVLECCRRRRAVLLFRYLEETQLLLYGEENCRRVKDLGYSRARRPGVGRPVYKGCPVLRSGSRVRSDIRSEIQGSRGPGSLLVCIFWYPNLGSQN